MKKIVSLLNVIFIIIIITNNFLNNQCFVFKNVYNDFFNVLGFIVSSITILHNKKIKLKNLLNYYLHAYNANLQF